ncbi:MAG TPA: amino acid adenylation domain-containing protein, partial [Longimicrobiaceae bacterium]|nr:amino acid adenylation domain-containing protein [Longimicrobiaceae bacterium]
IARRHETLRTGFTTVDGRPRQVIHPPLPSVVANIDLAHLPADAREAEAQRLTQEDATRTFDLARGRPFRATLLRLAGDDHLLLLNVHHIVSDGWSTGVMFRELSALYEAFARDEVSPLPELPIRYSDFAAWEAEQLHGGAMAAQLCYWTSQLADAPPLLTFPTDRPRPAVPAHAGRTFAFPIPADAANAVREMANALRVTPFMAMLAAWQMVLGRCAGQDDVVVGSPIAGRTQADLEGLIGFFVNMLPLRGDLRGDPTFAELLGRVKETTLTAYANQDVPFDLVVQALGAGRDRSHGAVFQAVFVYLNGPALSLALGDARVELVHPDTGTSEFDLNLSVEEEGEAYVGRLTYRTDLFGAGTIERLADAYRTVLEEAAAHPRRRISELTVPPVTSAATVSVSTSAVSASAESVSGDGAMGGGASPVVSGVSGDAARVAPTTATEVALAAIWAEVLGVERVGATDDFTARGGSELGASRVAERVREAFGVDVTIRAVLEARTVARLAARIDRMARPAGQGTDGIARISRGTHAPASSAQRRLWFVDRLRPGGSTYNVPEALRISGPIDVAALEAALGEIVARHEALRTVFATVDREPVQVVRPASPVTLAVTDLSAMPAGEREATARGLASAEADRPFDLERGPLFRASMIRLAADDHVLLVTMHHIVSDGWSMGVLYRELSALYAAFAGGASADLPMLPVQYADFAAWERERTAGGAMDADLAYWAERLKGAPALLELPADRPRPAMPSHRGGYEPVELSAELAEAVRALARGEGATPFMALLAGWQALLARASGQDDIVVGSPIAGRTRPELEGLIGFFVNMLPLRADVSADPTFRELLAQVRESTLGAFAHQELPFDRLVEEVAPERSLRHGPVFQVSFAFHNSPQTDLSLGDARVERFAQEVGFTKFDLELALWDGADGLRGTLGYAADLFDAANVRRLARQLRALLAAAVANPDARISRLSAMDEAERAALLAEWTADSVDATTSTVHALFAEQAEATPDAVAVGSGDARMTYAELDARSNRLARHLRARGVGAETRVGLSMERGPELVVALVAILKAGGAYVPLDPAYPAERLAFMLRDAGVSLVLATRDLAAQLPLDGIETVLADEEAGEIAARSSAAPEEVCGPDSLAYVVYTSGSTGTPKGVGVPHRAVVRLVRGADFCAMGADEVFLQMAPVAFDASTLEVWAPLLNGGRLAPFPAGTPTPDALADFIEREDVTTLWLTAGLFHQVTDARPGCFARVRQLLAGGDVLSVPHVRRVMEMHPHLRLVNGYGPTENTTFTCCRTIRPEDAARPGIPLGRAIRGTRAYVLDPALQPVADGLPGELYAGGEGVARGYVGRPALTAERFVPDPFSAAPGARMYRTGDRVRRLADGAIEFMGRLDGQVKIRGFRIETGEIEAVLAAHPSIESAAVTVREDAPGDKRLVAYFTSPEAPSAADLRAHLKARLPEYMVPPAFVHLPSLPLNANGKVDRRALPAPSSDATAAGEYVAPRNSTESVLAGIWAEVLRLERVGAEDDFFALGGHSLRATQVTSRAEEAFRVPVPVAALFETPTVAGLAREIDRLREAGAAAGPSPIVPVARQARRPLAGRGAGNLPSNR